ncbi:response regulator [Pelagicoccus sp. SDUM812003]|uniref:response regulator n=1 Tax=Pelagicoccus sp. SDUM812003 TaxID=3041267 RepID=UPI00280DCAF7|nr:response regulator [Pelagicoccus sp. SDUM812003]MDQ8202129.1 response regulator [Pelagicoccus sp. SDUM812003]
MNERNRSDYPNGTALLAEDDELIRDIVTHYLHRLGYDVLEAANGKAAIDIIDQLENGKLDLIVTDLLMPKVGGEAVIETAKQRGACDRFLVMSGFSELSQNPNAAQESSLFIEKPFTFGSFEEKLSALRHR